MSLALNVQPGPKEKPQLFNRYRIAGSNIQTIQKGRLMYEQHLKNTADQLQLKFRKIGSTVYLADEQQSILVKADLIQ